MAWATWASSCAPRAGSSVHSVSVTMGTSSMPMGRMMGSPTPRLGGSQSRLEKSLL